MNFEWDTAKNESNIQKHGISFVTAAEVLMTRHLRIRSDREGEVRYLAVGEVNSRVISVVYSHRNERLRIISARKARKNEREAYYEVFS